MRYPRKIVARTAFEGLSRKTGPRSMARMKDPYVDLDATAQAELVRRREATPRELVDAAIARIEAVNPKLNAVITPLFDKARRAADGELPDGPFRGVPFLLKDLMCASGGDPVHSGMRLLKEAGFVAPADTYLAAKFRRAGFVFVGKTNTPEIGLAATTEPAAYGPTRNPWNPDRSAGGSSGGSGAAVAARLVAAAHANDGGGSIRIPASENGVVGLKPSRGRVSLGPAMGEAWHGLAIEGVNTRTVRDTAAILDAIQGPMPGDPYTTPPPARPYREEVGRDPGRLRIGFTTARPGGGAKIHAECVKAVESAAKLLESLGHRVEESHPAAYDEEEFWTRFNEVVNAHAARTVEEIGEGLGRAVKADELEAYTWRFVEDGRKIPATRYCADADWLQVWTRRMAAWWGDHDLLLTPTIAEPPPPLGDLGGPGGDPRRRWKRNLEVIPFTPAFNATGQPGISLPLHWSADGLPIGIHLVAAYGCEDVLIRVAARLEEAAPWKDRRPPISA